MNLQEQISRIQSMMGIINEDSSTKEIIFDIINDEVKGADLYIHKGSLWLIFTDDKKWVLELTKDGTLWYNYYFFQSCFDYLSLNAMENQHYITDWVEDTIKNGIKNTERQFIYDYVGVEDTIKNGIKNTEAHYIEDIHGAYDTVQNGIKQTKQARNAGLDFLEIMSKIDDK